MDTKNYERRVYSEQDRKEKLSNCMPVSILTPHILLSTTIDLSKIENLHLKRAAKWHSHISWETRNLLIAITELKRMVSNLDVKNHTKKKAIILYKKLFKLKKVRGRSIIGMIAATLYYSCKFFHEPITIDDIVNESPANKKHIIKCYEILLLELKLPNIKVDPMKKLRKYCSDLNINDLTYSKIRKYLAKYLEENSICGKDPNGLCGAAIYLYIRKRSQKKIPQNHIANVVGITEVTLRSRYKELVNSEVTKNFLFQI